MLYMVIYICYIFLTSLLVGGPLAWYSFEWENSQLGSLFGETHKIPYKKMDIKENKVCLSPPIGLCHPSPVERQPQKSNYKFSLKALPIGHNPLGGGLLQRVPVLVCIPSRLYIWS